MLLYLQDYNIHAESRPDNTTIWSSDTIKHIRDMKSIINYIRKCDETSSLHKRSEFGLICEWRTHNLLSDLNIFKYRTKDVDLNANQSIVFKIGYFIGSLFYFHW